MDLQSSDGHSLLLKHVSSHAIKMHDYKLLKSLIFYKNILSLSNIEELTL